MDDDDDVDDGGGFGNSGAKVSCDIYGRLLKVINNSFVIYLFQLFVLSSSFSSQEASKSDDTSEVACDVWCKSSGWDRRM